MATAKRFHNDPKLKTYQAYEPQPDTIQLVLTLEEAQTLKLVTHRIGGRPEGRRGDINAIADALEQAGIRAKSCEANSHHFVARDSWGITFKDTRSPFVGAYSEQQGYQDVLLEANQRFAGTSGHPVPGHPPANLEALKELAKARADSILNTAKADASKNPFWEDPRPRY